MVNTQVMVGNWHRILGKLQKRWGELTDDDFDEFDGDANALVGLIERKTGEAREVIENYLEDLTYEAGAAVGRASKRARNYVRRAAETVQESTQQASERAKRTYAESVVRIRRYPLRSVAAAFGAGVLAGIVVGLGFRLRRD